MLTTFSPPGYTMSGVHPHREIWASWRDLIEHGAVARGEYVLRATHPSGSQCEYSLTTEIVPWFVENTYQILRLRANLDTLKTAKKQVDCNAVDAVELVSKSLFRAWSLGQKYWQQAESCSYQQNIKAGETQSVFRQLVEETCATIARGAKEKFNDPS